MSNTEQFDICREDRFEELGITRMFKNFAGDRMEYIFDKNMELLDVRCVIKPTSVEALREEFCKKAEVVDSAEVAESTGVVEQAIDAINSDCKLLHISFVLLFSLLLLLILRKRK